MFDTHAHLNFKAFEGREKEVIRRAKDAGVDFIVIPGTDVESSKKAIEIAQRFENMHAAVGIHPHHIYKFRIKNLELRIKEETRKIEELLANKKVVAIGEVGVDRHYYKKTKYSDYQIDESFIQLQKEFLKAQIQLAIKYDKSLILHNREAKGDLLEVLKEVGISKLEGRMVFHCCEPDMELLDFAKDHKIYIGVDGDVTYREDKQEFIKKVPLDILVLETDSPFLTPEPLRSEQKYFANEPKNLKIIAESISKTINVSINQLTDTTTNNARRLFQL